MEWGIAIVNLVTLVLSIRFVKRKLKELSEMKNELEEKRQWIKDWKADNTGEYETTLPKYYQEQENKTLKPNHNMKSTLWTLRARDFLKGLVMAGLVPVFVIVQQSISANNLVFNWKAIGMAAVAGFGGYLTKNFFSDDVKAAQKTLADAQKDGFYSGGK